MQKLTNKGAHKINTIPRYIVLLSYFMFSLCEDTVTKIKETDWFFSKLLINDDTIGKNFDLITSYSFLSSTGETSCFSPICAEINFHLQLIHCEYEMKYCGPSATHLKILINKIRKVNKKILKTANYVYMPVSESVNRLTSEPYGYRFEVYGNGEEDINDVCEAYENWISRVTEGGIESELPRESLIMNSRVYVSSIIFKDDWFSKFDPMFSEEEDFTQANNKVVKRMYMRKESNYRYRKLTKNGSSFEMVVVPYLEKNSKGKTSRVMVYLIPENNKIRQADLWNDFYEHSVTFGGIGQTISNAKFELIDLYIPKIEKLESKINAYKFFNNIFGEGKADYFASEMCTYLDIDEDGTKASAVMTTTTAESICMSIPLRANVPHVAFIYDLDLDRILYILNDNGPEKNNNY